MSRQLANTWKAYYSNLRSNERADKNLESFANATLLADRTDFEHDLIRDVTEDPDCVIMTLAAVSKKIKFYHSISNFGVIRVDPEHKIVGLDGFGPSATPVIFSNESLLSKLDLNTPSYRSLRRISDPEDCHPTAEI